MDAKIENGALHITAQNEGTAEGKTESERYEQFIALPKPVQADKVRIEKKDEVVVVTVPKTTPDAPAVAAVTPGPAASPPPGADSGGLGRHHAGANEPDAGPAQSNSARRFSR